MEATTTCAVVSKIKIASRTYPSWSMKKTHKIGVTALCGIYGYSNCQTLFDTEGCLAAVGIVKFSACAADLKRKVGNATTAAWC